MSPTPSGNTHSPDLSTGYESLDLRGATRDLRVAEDRQDDDTERSYNARHDAAGFRREPSYDRRPSGVGINCFNFSALFRLPTSALFRRLRQSRRPGTASIGRGTRGHSPHPGNVEANGQLVHTPHRTTRKDLFSVSDRLGTILQIAATRKKVHRLRQVRHNQAGVTVHYTPCAR